MTKFFREVEEVLADEDFMAWYHHTDKTRATAWSEWLLANPQFNTIVAQARSFLDQLPAQVAIDHLSVEASLQQLNQKIDRLESATAPVLTMRTSRRKWWIAAAAAILLLAGSFTIWNMVQNNKPVINANFGEVCSNQLPDGSTMILNANSNAKLSEGWEGSTDREVWLNGEAYFKVKKTAARSRFIVHTGQLDVIVTGTQFNVMHRDNKTSVLLTEGSVTIRTNDGKELAMKPGDYVEMNDNMVVRKAAKEENVLAWKENMLAFDSTSIPQVAKIISNHYGIKVTIADPSVNKESITGMMPNNNLDDLLKAIEMLGDVKVEKLDKEIIISKNH